MIMTKEITCVYVVCIVYVVQFVNCQDSTASMVCNVRINHIMKKQSYEKF